MAGLFDISCRWENQLVIPLADIARLSLRIGRLRAGTCAAIQRQFIIISVPRHTIEIPKN